MEQSYKKSFHEMVTAKIKEKLFLTSFETLFVVSRLPNSTGKYEPKLTLGMMWFLAANT